MDRNLDGSSQYQLGWRARHTTAVVGEVLYCWGGSREGLDASHCDTPTKSRCTSVIDAFNLSLSGVWSSHPTSGTPPLGIRGVSCTTINNNIYYFGGYCGHDSCYHNSLNCLDTLTLQWKELQPTGDNSVNKRGYGGMIAMGSEGEPQQLLVIGGLAPISTITQYHHQFKYNKIPGRDNRLSTNEHSIYNLSSGQWIVPSVSGQCFPPTTHFIIEKINYSKGIMYGGTVTDGDRDETTNSIYLFQLSDNTISWEYFKEGSVPNDGLWPKGRDHHASTIINGVSTSPILVVIGGLDSDDELVNDCLLLDTNQYNWMKIPLPDSVTGRYYHTVSSFVLDPNHVFLIIVGGDIETELKVGGGVMEWVNKPVSDPNITMIVELVFNDGQWSVGPVLDSFNIPLLYKQILKERRKELIEKYVHMTDKVKEYQVINESLRHENQSLQEALCETNSLSVSTAAALTEKDELIQRLQTQLQETEKQLFTKSTFPMYGAKLELEDQDIKEKQIHLENQVIVKKEKMDVTLHEHDQFSNEGTNSVGVQFNYMIPSMDNLECLSDVQVAEKKLFLIQSDKPQLMNWEKYGLRIGVQEGSLLSSETVEAAVVALVGGQFQFPPNTVLVSAVYAVSLSKPLLKRLKLEIQHCVDLTGQPDLAQYLKFAIAPVSTPSLPYQFSIAEGGEFSSNSGYGFIERNKFSLVCILGEESTNGGNEDREEQPQQQENEEGGEGSDSDDDTSSTPSGASGSCKESTTKETNLPTNTVSVAGSTLNTDHANKVQSTGVRKAITYVGLVYYEEDGVEDLVTFTAAKNLEALIHFIERKHSQAKIGPDISFCFKFPYDYIELNLTAEQDEPFTGWILRPHTKPTRLNQEAIDKFGDKEHSRPSRCLISVYGSPDAVPFLNYFIPLEGVACPVAFNIHRARRNFTVPVPPSTNPTTSSFSNVQVVHVRESTAVSSTGGASNCISPSSSGNDETVPVLAKRRREGGFDIKNAKQKIKKVMNENHSDFAEILESSLKEIANKLFEAKIIAQQVQKLPTYDTIAASFLSLMKILDSKSDLEKHCMTFLEALSSAGGPAECVAKCLQEKWTAALEGALQFEQSVKRVRTNDDA